MSTVLGLLNNTIAFSSVDGPGNRFVVFLQGCNFNCVTCHNPYTITRCTDCGLCVGPCPEHALSIEDGPLIVLDTGACTLCDVCIEVCPEDSTPLARVVTVRDLIEEIRVVAPFISGITVSGGEATQQPEFVADLFSTLKADPHLAHLTTFVDSNGAAPVEVWKRLADVMDGAMVDLKALDPATHLRLTARENDQVLASIEYLAQHDLLYEVRLLIVPGYNDDTQTVLRTAEWLSSVDPSMRIKLIGYRAHGVRPEALHIPEATGELLEHLETILRKNGFDQIAVT